MEPPLDRPEFERWRGDADRAHAAARSQRDAGTHNWCCFLAEQSVQLAVKGLLHGLGMAPWGHDLAKLADGMAEAGIAVPMDIRDRLIRLGRYYIAPRYPDAHAGGGAAEHFSATDASDALRDAEEVLAFVDRTWKELGG